MAPKAPNEEILIMDHGKLMTKADSIRKSIIRQRNDLARTAMGICSRVVMTQGVAALGPKACSKIREKVETYNNFTKDNDPYNEHDFGSFHMDVEDSFEHIMWKIDYYDENYEYGIEGDDPKCRRVLTIMLAEEY